MNIKLEQYKIFNEAASTLSFSLAARNLYISQSAVSQTIKILEKELNTQLFIRQSKGVILTKEGEILYQKISQALTLITDAENEINNQLELTKGQLTIGAGDTISENYVMPYLVQFHQLYPHVSIQMINRTSLEIIDLLKLTQKRYKQTLIMITHDENIAMQADRIIVIEDGKIKKEDINQDLFSNYLYTKDSPDPDLIIRPSAEQRISNFLLWQCAYSEFWYSNVNWPDFKEEDLQRAIYEYQNRNRRFGGV